MANCVEGSREVKEDEVADFTGVCSDEEIIGDLDQSGLTHTQLKRSHSHVYQLNQTDKTGTLKFHITQLHLQHNTLLSLPSLHTLTPLLLFSLLARCSQ